MSLIIWNETDKIRYSLSLHAICNGKRTPAIKELAFSGGFLLARCISFTCCRVYIVHARFSKPHFFQLSWQQAAQPVYVYAGGDISAAPAGSPSIEIAASDECCRSWFWYSLQMQLLILEPVRANGYASWQELHPVPYCSETQDMMRELLSISGNTNGYCRWSPDIGQQLLRTLIHEAHHGSAFFQVPFHHRSKIQAVAQQLWQEPGTHDKIEDMAKRAGISATYLKRFFLILYGRPVQTFRQHYRMQMVCRLLLQPGRSLQDIALACGYTDDSALVKAFRKHFGISPGLAFR